MELEKLRDTIQFALQRRMALPYTFILPESYELSQERFPL